MRRFATFLFLSLFIFGLSFQPVSAQGLINCGITQPGGDYRVCNFCDFLDFLQNVLNFIMWTLTPVTAVFLFAVGGFFILFAGESPEKRKRGYEVIKTTIIGFLIIFVSWVLINEILLFLASQNSGNPSIINNPWNQIQCQ